MEKLIFASVATAGSQEAEVLIFVRSLRTFGGALAGNPVWVFYPDVDGERLSATTQDKLAALDVRLVPFEIDPAALEFPFAGLVWAAAAAEALAQGQTGLLAWMHADTLVIQEPAELLLVDGKSLAYCPVHHKLLGAAYDEPLAPYWALVYEHCNVPADHVFPMVTIVDEQRIRPYFNAGMLVVRPERGLLRAWRDRFQQLYRQPFFGEFYRQDVLYVIFIHQAILAGVIMAEMPQDELHELSRRFNYPLHLYAEDHTAHRPVAISDLVTCRYDTSLREPGWMEKLPVTGRLKDWMLEQLEGKTHA